MSAVKSNAPAREGLLLNITLYSVYLLYWYKGTNADGYGAGGSRQELASSSTSHSMAFLSWGTQFTTQFTCFTGTKVQILTAEELQDGGALLG